ncbi:MAG: glycine--tRNA ligase subunit beta [Wenzhouxiangella sp.]
MSARHDLLIELGCEELPARLLASQLDLLADGLGQRLVQAGLMDSVDNAERMATPRRLAVCFKDVLARQADRRIERRGPPLKAAFSADGEPTQAALGFARGLGLEVSQLDKLETEQGAWLVAQIEEPGQDLAELLPGLLEETVRDMAGARSMRWADRSDRFLRPVRWLLVLHGESVVPVSLFGLSADRLTHGHRVHSPGEQAVASSKQYREVLRQGRVLVDPAERRARIIEQSQALADAESLTADLPESLVDENAGLCEWPVAVMGSFDPAFLEVPAEALISSMQNHQKCFALRDADGQLSHRFIAIANIDSDDVAAMTAGFERVICPRLSDARFFWDQDRKQALADRVNQLNDILFQEKLGSIGDKQRRLAELAGALAAAFEADTAQVQRAAELCKCDLTTDMVGEFPELQGTMGRHYALDSGENPAVATAVESHYQPRNAGDALPADPAGRCLAVADRIDTLLGIFAAGQKPRGSKDPFALRRAALGIVRILEDSGSSLSLDELLDQAAEVLGSQLPVDSAVLVEVREFLLERLRSHAAEQGIETTVFQAVTAGKMGSVADFMARARAVQAFTRNPRAGSLISANKRTSNLLKKADDVTIDAVKESLLTEPQEKDLFSAMLDIEQQIAPLLARADYDNALETLAWLKDPVDQFFDGVMVMADDAALRTNRLALLSRLRGLIADIADLAALGR